MDNNTKKIEQSLSRVKVKMDNDWHAQTRAMLEQLSDDVTASETKKERISLYTLFFNFFFMRHRNIALLGLAALIVIASAGLFFLSRSRQEIVTNNNFTEEQKQEIFMNIIYNNPESLLAVTTGGNPSFSNQDSFAGKSIQSNFIKTIAKTTLGTNSNTCGAAFGEDGSITTFYDFTEKNGYNYNRIDRFLGDEFRGTYISKNLINEKRELLSQEVVEYAGGEYAVKSITTFQPGSVTIGHISDEITEEMTEENVEQTIAQFFSSNAELKVVNDVSGEEYYVIQWEANVNCETGMMQNLVPSESIIQGNNFPDKKIFVQHIRTSDFMATRFEEYLESVSPDSLITKIETTVEYKNVSFQDVEDIFTLDVNIPVRVIYEGEDYSSSFIPEESSEQLLTRIKNEIPFAILVDGQGVNSSAYASMSPQSNDSFRSDKDFYPDTEYGRSQSEGSNSFFSSAPLFTTLISKDNEMMTSFQIDMYKGSVNPDQLMNQWSMTAKELDVIDENVMFTINGTKVDGALKIKTVQEDIQYFTDENGNLVKNTFDPLYYISCDENTCTRKIITAVFEYEGYTFSLLNYNQLYDDYMMTKLNYSVYETNKDVHLNRIKEALEFVAQ